MLVEVCGVQSLWIMKQKRGSKAAEQCGSCKSHTCTAESENKHVKMTELVSQAQRLNMF